MISIVEGKVKTGLRYVAGGAGLAAKGAGNVASSVGDFAYKKSLTPEERAKLGDQNKQDKDVSKPENT